MTETPGEETENQTIISYQHELLHKLELLGSSDHPWRSRYVEHVIAKIEKLLASGNDESALMILEKLRKTLEQWLDNVAGPSDDKDDNQGMVTEIVVKEQELAKRIKDLLNQEQNINQEQSVNQEKRGSFNLADQDEPEISILRQEIFSSTSMDSLETEALWKIYQKWYKAKAHYLDSLCFSLLRRTKFWQELKFNKYLTGEWGPYNQQYNIIKALKRLNHSKPEWLEAYLLLYESLREFEETIK